MERVPQFFLMHVERVPHQNYFIFIGGAEMKKKNLKRIGSTVLVTTMAMGASFFKGNYTVDYGGIVASSLMIIIPELIFYGIFQKNIVEGMTAGAVKG